MWAECGIQPFKIYVSNPLLGESYLMLKGFICLEPGEYRFPKKKVVKGSLNAPHLEGATCVSYDIL